MAKKGGGKKDDGSRRLIADNRKARHNYFIEDNLEAGLVLTGTEVKSLRTGKANIAESHCTMRGGEVWLENCHIAEYEKGNRFNHHPRRERKLLLRKHQIAKLAAQVAQDGITLVPLKLYFNEDGRVKMDLGIVKGKKQHDKRASDKDRDWKIQKQRILKASDY